MLEAVHIRKAYPGTVALDDVSLQFAPGKVHALVGKNGAGKSTLVKIFSGAVTPTLGSIRLEGRELRLRSPRDALQCGVATVYQELSLVPELTVGENILFGRLPRRGWIIDWPAVYRRAAEVLDQMGAKLNVRAKAGRLGIASQQIVEIAKAMSHRACVLILDEPTSALSQHEAQQLFRLVRLLASQGVTVLYITHRLQELSQVADTVTVLRDGRLAGTIPVEQATSERLVSLMFGAWTPTAPAAASCAEQPPAPAELQPRPSLPAQPILEVRHLSRQGKFSDVSFALHPGEVVGIAGMLGSGRTELLMSIFGAEPFDSGEVLVAGNRVRPRSPRVMKRLGLALTPENRKQQALVLGLSTRENLCLAGLAKIARLGIISDSRERDVVEQMIQRLGIAVSNPHRAVESLSGGNQQKVVVGNWLVTEPRVMLFDEPDARHRCPGQSSKSSRSSASSARRGVAALVVSSELEELFQVCQRILVLRQGRIVAESRADSIRLDQLFRAAMEA